MHGKPRLLAAAFASAWALAFSSPALAEASLDEREAPAGEAVYPPPSTRYNLIGAGILTTGAWYGAAAGMSYAFPDAPGARDLRTPVVGPWLAIANNGCPPNEPDCSRAWVVARTILTAIDGIGQAAGLGLILEGVFLPTQEPAARAAPPAKRPTRRLPPSQLDDDDDDEVEEPTPSTEPPPGPLFYLPAPTVVGSSGVGLTLGGIF